MIKLLTKPKVLA